MSPSPRALRLASLPAALGLLVTYSLIRSDPAAACVIATVYEHEIDPDDPDAVAPGVVSLVSIDVADLGDSEGCGSRSSCDGTGTISIVVQAEDDATPPESIGFMIELVSGSLPPGLSLPDGPVRGWERGDGKVDLVFVWSPEQTDSMEFVVRVSAVDGAGNVGDSTEVPVVLEKESGCAAAGLPGPGSGAVWLVTALAALFILRRPRRAAQGLRPCRDPAALARRAVPMTGRS